MVVCSQKKTIIMYSAHDAQCAQEKTHTIEESVNIGASKLLTSQSIAGLRIGNSGPDPTHTVGSDSSARVDVLVVAP